MCILDNYVFFIIFFLPVITCCLLFVICYCLYRVMRLIVADSVAEQSA